MKKTFILEGLDCANCASKIERKISTVKGINSVSVNFLSTKLVMELDDDNADYILEEAFKMVKKVDSDINIKKA